MIQRVPTVYSEEESRAIIQAELDGKPHPFPEKEAKRRGASVDARESNQPDAEKAQVYQIAWWSDDQRAIPVNFIACALFAGIQGKSATYLDGVEIANANGMRITFKGKRLTQTHADVWEGIMHLSRQLPEGSTVRFRARQLLRLIGRHTGKSQRDQLHEWISDLVATNVEISDTTNKRHYFGSLVPRGVADDGIEDDNSVYAIEINRDLAKLFASGFATVNWDQRRRLQKKPLALWLQHYFSKFTKPVLVSELHRLAGSNAELKEFRRKLRIALEELRKEGVLEAWRIDEATDAVHITVPGRASLKPKGPFPVPTATTAQAELPLLSHSPLVSQKALDAFRRVHGRDDGARCASDFVAWLTKSGNTAANPDAAFLGFAKKWVADN